MEHRVYQKALMKSKTFITISRHQKIKGNWHYKYIIKIESNNKLKEIDIKNRSCYYFSNTIKTENVDLGNILIDEKSYEKILVHDISCKTLIGAKPMRIRFDKINWFIRIYNGSKHLLLFRPENFDAMNNRIGIL